MKINVEDSENSKESGFVIPSLALNAYLCQKQKKF